MLEVNGAYRHGRYKRIWLHHLTPNVNVFATQDGRKVGRTGLVIWIHIMLIWMLKNHGNKDTLTNIAKDNNGHWPSMALAAMAEAETALSNNGPS